MDLILGKTTNFLTSTRRLDCYHSICERAYLLVKSVYLYRSSSLGFSLQLSLIDTIRFEKLYMYS